jgi:hypothetical protein
MQVQSFDSFKVSTKTFIVHTNLSMKIDEIFYKEVLPISHYVVVQKKRGRKKKIQEEDPNKNLLSGAIIRVQYKKEHHGVILKPKSKGFFRNSITVVISVEDKLINFKASRNGKFQITGCKTDDQAEQCVLYFWSYIRERPDLYELKDVPYLKAYFEPVMYNIDFPLGFQINRENLDIYINTHTPYTSLLETTFGYTGVNIKMPITVLYKNVLIKYKEFNNHIKTGYIPYDELILKFKPDDKDDIKYNTFLVFQSGKVIMSGKSHIFMRNAYYDFLKIIADCSPLIREVIES